MKQEALKFFTDTHLTVIGLIIFLGYFVVVLHRVFRSNKSHIQYLQNIPFAKEDLHGKQ